MRRSRSRTRGCTGSSSGRRSSTASRASRTAVSARRRSTAEIARAERLGTPLTLVLADLDDFKAINDDHGHAAGDDVLREFAAVLRATVRDSDLAGRWGGEEFLLLLPGADAVGGAQLADRVRSSLAERSFAGNEGAVVSVTCSFGVAQHEPGGGRAGSLRRGRPGPLPGQARGQESGRARAPVRSF